MSVSWAAEGREMSCVTLTWRDLQWCHCSKPNAKEKHHYRSAAVIEMAWNGRVLQENAMKNIKSPASKNFPFGWLYYESTGTSPGLVSHQYIQAQASSFCTDNLERMNRRSVLPCIHLLSPALILPWWVTVTACTALCWEQGGRANMNNSLYFLPVCHHLKQSDKWQTLRHKQTNICHLSPGWILFLS